MPTFSKTLLLALGGMICSGGLVFAQTCAPPPTCGATEASRWNGSGWECISVVPKVQAGIVSHNECGAWSESFNVGFNISGAMAAPYSDRWTGGWHGAVVDNVSWSGSVVTITTSIWGDHCDGEAFRWIAVGY